MSKRKTTAPKRSCANSLRKITILLPGEDPAKLQQITHAFYHKLRPRDQAEAALIDVMIAHLWRGNRILGYESQLLIGNAEEIHPSLAESYHSISADRLMMHSWDGLKQDTILPLNRYMVSARNMFKTALLDLERLRKLEADPNSPFVQPVQIQNTAPTLSINPQTLPVTGATIDPAASGTRARPRTRAATRSTRTT